MKKQLAYVAPLRAGIVLGILYGILSLIIVPFLLIAAIIGSRSATPGPGIFGVGLVILVPVLYAVVGFIGGIIAAAIYNVVAKWTGGFEFEVGDVPAVV